MSCNYRSLCRDLTRHIWRRWWPQSKAWISYSGYILPSYITAAKNGSLETDKWVISSSEECLDRTSLQSRRQRGLFNKRWYIIKLAAIAVVSDPPILFLRASTGETYTITFAFATISISESFWPVWGSTAWTMWLKTVRPSVTSFWLSNFSRTAFLENWSESNSKKDDTPKILWRESRSGFGGGNNRRNRANQGIENNYG